MEITVVKTNDEFFNVIRILQDNGYSDFHRIHRLEFYKRYVNIIIKTCRFNKTNGKIEKVYKIDLKTNEIINMKPQMCGLWKITATINII